MKRTYMVVFERMAEDNWGAWCPDISGAVGAGDSLPDARTSLCAGMDIMLKDLRDRGLPLPAATATAIDFAEFEPDPVHSHYEIEWLTIDLPDIQGAASTDAVQQAA